MQLVSKMVLFFLLCVSNEANAFWSMEEPGIVNTVQWQWSPIERKKPDDANWQQAFKDELRPSRCTHIMVTQIS